MNAITEITAALPADLRARTDGWTAERQRTFLERIAAGQTVDAAAQAVGMSKQSAYALRNRAAGAAFAVGWAAANLIARDHIADSLMARALDGQVDTYTRADGTEITRHRYDNRLATTLLIRLDRMVEAAPGPEAHAARIAAREFDAYLDLVEKSASPARAALFLSGRVREAGDPDLDSIVTLARADRWLRTGAGTAAEIDVSDLDPTDRAGWSADQWARAEAAGLVAIAPVPSPPDGQVGQLRDDGSMPAAPTGPVWWSEGRDERRTSFPPPADFRGDEDGEFGDEGYSRALTPDEEAMVEEPRRVEIDARWITEARERDRWFAAVERGEWPTDVEPEPQEPPPGGSADA